MCFLPTSSMVAQLRRLRWLPQCRALQGAQWYEPATGTAQLSDALTVLDCDLDTVLNHHSHAIPIGRVRATETREDVEPLLHWRGGYRRLAGNLSGLAGEQSAFVRHLFGDDAEEFEHHRRAGEWR